MNPDPGEVELADSVLFLPRKIKKKASATFNFENSAWSLQICQVILRLILFFDGRLGPMDAKLDDRPVLMDAKFLDNILFLIDGTYAASRHAIIE